MGESCKKIVVMGAGNILLKDEGIGVHIVRKLIENNPPLLNIGVEFIDAGTSAFDIFQNLEKNIEKLIIIDSVKMGQKPGTVIRLDYDELLSLLSIGSKEGAQLLLQNASLVDALHVISFSGNTPAKMVFIGVEPKETNAGIGISSDIESKIPDIIKIVSNEIMERPQKNCTGVSIN